MAVTSFGTAAAASRSDLCDRFFSAGDLARPLFHVILALWTATISGSSPEAVRRGSNAPAWRDSRGWSTPSARGCSIPSASSASSVAMSSHSPACAKPTRRTSFGCRAGQMVRWSTVRPAAPQSLAVRSRLHRIRLERVAPRAEGRTRGARPQATPSLPINRVSCSP